jgi:Ca-activated chloride channel family protein
VYADIGSSIGWRTEPREITPYLAVFALLAGVAAGGTSLLWFARIP